MQTLPNIAKQQQKLITTVDLQLGVARRFVSRDRFGAEGTLLWAL